MGFEEDTYTAIFSALKHPIRRKILRMLEMAPATYTEIMNALGIETSLLNYHLENLSALLVKNDEGRYHLRARSLREWRAGRHMVCEPDLEPP